MQEYVLLSSVNSKIRVVSKTYFRLLVFGYLVELGMDLCQKYLVDGDLLHDIHFLILLNLFQI